MTPLPSPSPSPDESTATAPEIARFGIGDRPWGANDDPFGGDTPLPAPSADGEVR